MNEAKNKEMRQLKQIKGFKKWRFGSQKKSEIVIFWLP